MKRANLEFLNSNQIKFLDSGVFFNEYGDAIHALGKLKGSEDNLPNPALLISPLTAREATTSSLIEGTVSTVSEVFQYEAEGKGGEDTLQVVNYRRALTYGVEELKRGRNLSPQFIESLHRILLEGVRFHGPPGRFRQSQVYVANHPKDPIEKARYIPPEFLQIPGLMENLINYINHGTDMPLVKAGIAHYQFEAIHPFQDGNGRLGRMLIPLILVKENLLDHPILYLSGFMEEYKTEYIDALHQVDEKGTFEPWLKFFFEGVATQAQETLELVKKIFNLRDEIKNHFKGTKSPYVLPFLDFIFETPVFTVSKVKSRLGMTNVTAYKILDLFEKKTWLKDLGKRAGREKLYSFSALIDLIR